MDMKGTNKGTHRQKTLIGLKMRPKVPNMGT